MPVIGHALGLYGIGINPVIRTDYIRISCEFFHIRILQQTFFQYLNVIYDFVPLEWNDQYIVLAESKIFFLDVRHLFINDDRSGNEDHRYGKLSDYQCFPQTAA